MNFGFNSNVRVGDAVFHVQTEDRGPSHPFLDTVVYASGRVVHKRSSSYQDLTGGTTQGEVLEAKLHERLSQQHREVMAQLEAGTLQLNIPGAPPVEKKAATVSTVKPEELEVVLLNPKSWLASGKVTLEVELRRKGLTEAIGGADIEAFLETDKDISTSFRGRADANGRATLSFPLPVTVADGTSLVIRSTNGELYAELRFLLKARTHDKSGTPASK